MQRQQPDAADDRPGWDSMRGMSGKGLPVSALQARLGCGRALWHLQDQHSLKAQLSQRLRWRYGDAQHWPHDLRQGLVFRLWQASPLPYLQLAQHRLDQ